MHSFGSTKRCQATSQVGHRKKSTRRVEGDLSGQGVVGDLSGKRVIGGSSNSGVTDDVTDDELDTESLRRDVIRGLVVLGQLFRSTWWGWTFGSSPVFWRWNSAEQISAARDGMHILVQSPLPRSRHGFKRSRFDTDTRKLVSKKISTMIEKSDLEVCHVQTSLHYFAVPKVDSYIRVVLDGTSCGLNESLWSPNFFLPMSRNASELISFADTWMVDVDFGEFFHNFLADERMRKHAGVDTIPLSPFLDFAGKGTSQNPSTSPLGLRWSRLFMGMKSSPYKAVRYYYWGEEFAREIGGTHQIRLVSMKLFSIFPEWTRMTRFNPSMSSGIPIIVACREMSSPLWMMLESQGHPRNSVTQSIGSSPAGCNTWVSRMLLENSALHHNFRLGRGRVQFFVCQKM